MIDKNNEVYIHIYIIYIYIYIYIIYEMYLVVKKLMAATH